jgi:hypothetical protein
VKNVSELNCLVIALSFILCFCVMSSKHKAVSLEGKIKVIDEHEKNKVQPKN